MQDELAARQRAITLRLAGRLTKAIYTAVGRSEVWLRKWWGRYLESGSEGLYDLTRANHRVAQRILPELERAILADLKNLGVRPLPCERTVERVLERNNVSASRVRQIPLRPRQQYPGPKAGLPAAFTRSIWWDRSTSRGVAIATTSG
jgi:hypothetical protein